MEKEHQPMTEEEEEIFDQFVLASAEFVIAQRKLEKARAKWNAVRPPTTLEIEEAKKKDDEKADA